MGKDSMLLIRSEDFDSSVLGQMGLQQSGTGKHIFKRSSIPELVPTSLTRSRAL